MARYRIEFGDREVDLPGGEMLVGRGIECHVRLRAPSVSRRHLRILQVANAVVAYDLDSRNGTFVNGARAAGATPLRDGDVVRLGTQSFRLREVGPEDEEDQEPETWETTRERAERAAAGQPEPAGPARRGREDFAVTRETLVPPDGDAEEAQGLEGVAVGGQRCAACGALLEVGAPYCPTCAAETYSAPSYRTCPGCRALMAAEERACPKCGLERPRAAVAPDDRDPLDRRGAPRRPATLRALYVSGSMTFDAEVADISLGGLFMAGDLLDPVGTKADIILSTDDRGGARFVGEVVRVVDDPDSSRGERAGMGIRFTGVMPSARRWLDGYLAGLGQGAPA